MNKIKLEKNLKIHLFYLITSLIIRKVRNILIYLF